MKEKTLWTTHAMERAAEYGFSAKDLINGWLNASEQELSEKMKAWKFKRYGMKSLSDRFYWDDKRQILFTVSISQSGQWFIQTVTKGRGNFSR